MADAASSAGFRFTLRMRGTAGGVLMTVPVMGDLAWFSAKDRNAVLRQSLHVALEKWRQKYLRLRFEPYARDQLGYSEAPSTYKRKARRTVAGIHPRPNVETGDARAMILAGAHPEVRAAGGRLAGVVRFPAPPYLNQQKTQLTNRTLRALPMSELNDIATWMGEELRAMLSGATYGFRRKNMGPGRGRMFLPVGRLTPEQSRQASAFVAPQRNPSAALPARTI